MPKEMKKVRIMTPDMEELVPVGDGERNWRGVLIALLVIIVVLGLILVSTVALSPPDRGPRATLPKVTLGLVVTGRFTWAENATWISDDEFSYRDPSGGITIYNAKNQRIVHFLKNTTFRMLNAIDYILSPDKKYVVFISDRQKVYKHTTEAVYRMVEIESSVRYALGPKDTNFEETTYKLQKFKFSPNNNSYAFIHQNNLYYSNSSNNRKPVKLTESGSDKVSNGYPDWLYQEEIFKDDTGFWFSPSGNYLAYGVFNDTEVDVTYIPKYLRQDLKIVSYPKRGRPNPKVTLFLVDLRKGNYQTVQLTSPKSFENSFGYLLKVEWSGDEQLESIWMNRYQNASIYMTCIGPSFNCSKTYSSRGSGDDDLVQLTPKNWRLGLRPLSIHGVYAGYMYFEASPEDKINERHLYRVHVESNVEECLTCPTKHIGVINTTEEATSPSCLYVNAEFSMNGTYHMLTCLGPETPTISLVQTSTNTKITLFEPNFALKEIYDGLSVPQVKIFKIAMEDDGGGETGREARARLEMPAGLRLGEDITFPLILRLSCKPGESCVTSRWSVDFMSYLVSEQNFLVLDIQVESRKFEVEDHLSVIRYISDMEFVDSTKIGLFASGYGTYLAAKLIAEDTNIFKSTVFLNGIYNWNQYNSFWSERYSLEGDVLDLAGQVGKHTKLLLIHATSELNAEYSQAMYFSKALIQSGVLYTHLAYPDTDEDFEGYQRHLFTSIEDFYMKTIQPIDYSEWETGTSYFNFRA